MEGSAKIKGLDSAMKAMQAAFPDNPKKQSQIINGAMGGAARKSMLPLAKSLALKGDGSGALSEALAVRAQKAKHRRGKAGGMQLTPVRSNRKAMALYIQHYYTNKGKNPDGDVIIDGIRHGHLVEFGHKIVRGGRVVGHASAKPFLWPSTAAIPKYRALFAGFMKKRTESAVKRAARKK